MLSPSLVSAVECDLTLARQLAYFHIGYSPDGQDMEVEPEQFVSGALPDAVDQTPSPAANAATNIRVAVSNPVQRPRQGTCAVLMELTRPLTWLSNRSRHRESAAAGVGVGSVPTASTGGNAASVGTGGSASASGGAGTGRGAAHGVGYGGHSSGVEAPFSYGANTLSGQAPGQAAATTTALTSVHPPSSLGGAGSSLVNGSAVAGGGGTGSVPSSFTAAGGYASATHPSVIGGAANAAISRVGGALNNNNNSAAPAPSSIASAAGTAGQRQGTAPSTSPSSPRAALPLLVATATLEVVFPARYPLEPCQWHLSEEVSFGGIGDHSTSSWAVTAGHRAGSSRGSAAKDAASPTTTNNSPALSSHNGRNSRAGVWSTGASAATSVSGAGEEGVPRRHISSRLLAATAGENTLRAHSGGGGGGSSEFDVLSSTADSSAKLTAFIVPALGRRLLRWIAEGRQYHINAGLNRGAAAEAASAPSSGAPVADGKGNSAHTRSSRIDASPFLLDFACLLRCWSAVELDVHHVLLPSRVALAYGAGGGSTSTSTSGGGGARVLRAVTAGTHLSGISGGGSLASTAMSNGMGLTSSGGSLPGTVNNNNNSGGGGGGGGLDSGASGRLQGNAASTGGNMAYASTLGAIGAGAGGSGNPIHSSLNANPAHMGSTRAGMGAAVAGGNASSAAGGTSSTASAPLNLALLSGSNNLSTNNGVSSVGGVGGGGGSSGGVSGGGGGASTALPGTATAAGSTGASALYPYRRRAVKHFLAVLLPQGNVAVCGAVSGGAAVAASRRGGGVSVSANGPAAAGVPGVTAAAATATAASAARNFAPEPNAGPAIQLTRVPFCLLPLYEQPQTRKKGGEGEGANKTQQQQQSSRPPTAVSGTLLACTSQLVRGKLLPSFLLPSHVLGSAYKCEWDDVRIFVGRGADAALHANAKLAKALRLPDVSDLLQVLRRLTKNVGTTTTGDVYLGEVLWPTLMETVRVLRGTRLPFWAGLAVCSLLLPSVLEQEEAEERDAHTHPQSGKAVAPVGVLPTMPSLVVVGGDGRQGGGSGSAQSTARALQRWCHHFAELLQVVTYVERVLAVAQEYTRLCEVRLVRCALQRGQQQLLQQWKNCVCGGVGGTLAEMSPGGSAGHASRQQQGTAPPLPYAARSSPAALQACSFVLPVPPVEMCRRLHAPISVCAVCGLSLLRNTVKNVAFGGSGGETKEPAAPGSPSAGSWEAGPSSVASSPTPPAASAAASAASAALASVQARRAEGCLVVQCARCGHGGHVEHMSSWWNDPTVHCCPKGCDCICEY